MVTGLCVCLQKMAAYNEQYQKYLESLPEEERVALGGTTAKKDESPPASPDKKGSSKAQVCRLLLMVSSSLYVSHMLVAKVLSSLVFQSCPYLELVSPLQVTHLPPVRDLLLPLA